MTYYVTAYTNDKAKLIVHSFITNDPVAADFVAIYLEDLGFDVVAEQGE